MSYLDAEQKAFLSRLLKTFFAIPYSTDLDGKDVESLLRIVKKVKSRPSRRKELFDIVDEDTGYSVKTLWKDPKATKVDLQEQRFCDTISKASHPDEQGNILLSYMKDRIEEHMNLRKVAIAKSLILLKHWDKKRENFSFRYWEEDFKGYIENLYRKNLAGEIEWIVQPSGLHGRDRLKPEGKNGNMRLIRMHYKHNQIFTDHDIPTDADTIEFKSRQLNWIDVVESIESIILK